MMLKQIYTILFLALLAITFQPFAAFANGGDQRLVDNGRYYINLSRVPFTPRVGEKTSMLVSFFDVQANHLIQENLIVKIRISRLGGSGTAKRTFIFEQDNIPVHGGVLELPYTFNEPGLHEIFFDFAFASNSQKVYETPDFLMDVQPATLPNKQNQTILIGIIMGIAGFIVGLFMERYHISHKKVW